jgi:DNA-3-methyladenine glycosylase II
MAPTSTTPPYAFSEWPAQVGVTRPRVARRVAVIPLHGHGWDADKPRPRRRAARCGMSARVSHAEAARRLAAREPVIARLLAETGPPRLRRSTMSPFEALVQAIVYQQLAGAAARAIHGRLVAALPGGVDPEALLALSDDTLRTVGLSGAKVRSLRDLATKVLDGTVVVAPRRLARLSDEHVIDGLVTVRGVGRWTAQMFLMFQLRRLDVWPTGDLGVRNGYGLAWQVPTPTARALEPLGDPYRPYRSVAAWYCWRAAELYAGAAESAVTR